MRNDTTPALARMAREDDPFTVLGAVTPRGAPMRALLRISDERARLVAALRALTDTLHEQSPGFYVVKGARNADYSAAVSAQRTLLAELGEDVQRITHGG